MALALAALLLLPGGPARAEQVADSTFDVSVASPAFRRGEGPRVLIDAAHHNFHTASGRYRPFADLIRNDGFRVVSNVVPFSLSTLTMQNVLVIANAMGAEGMADSLAGTSAFSATECDAVRDWVRAGGGLLLIADHAPFGGAASVLASRFGVEMRNATTRDRRRGRAGAPGVLTFAPGAGLDTSHPIVRGPSPDARVRRVQTFAGQSLAGPPGSRSLLTLSRVAEDLLVAPDGASRAAGDSARPRASAAGRSQALAFDFGRGRVVVLGEAAMLSAQRAGPAGSLRVGMNARGNDNRALAINLMRWLARVY